MRIGLWAASLTVLVGLSSPLLGAPPNWPGSLTIATASPGGLYLIYGQGLAPILSEALGVPVSTQATQGADQNVLLLESGEAQLGFVTMGVALQAWNGTGEWTHGKQLRKLRALFPMYDTPFQFVVLSDSGIKSLADMSNKRIGIGPQGGTSGTYVPLVFKALNIPVTLRYGAWEILGKQLQSDLVDVLSVTVGAPSPIISELNETQQIELVAPTNEEIARLRETMPELGVSVVSAGSYPSLKIEYTTVGLFNFAVASKDLPADLVYEIVKAFYAGHDRMVKAHPAASESVVANLKRNEFLPYHPGAVRYYRENGINLPTALSASE
jgi:TRAP transporter TAXI family solute receptor